jgi:hypothetical protein
MFRLLALAVVLCLLAAAPAAKAGELNMARFEAIGPWRLVCERIGQLQAGNRTETCRAVARAGDVTLWVVRDPWSIWVDVEIDGCRGGYNATLDERTMPFGPDQRAARLTAKFTALAAQARRRCPRLNDLTAILRPADMGAMLARSDGLQSLDPDPARL